MSDVTLTVTAKGQVTLKQSVLAHLGVRPGDRITAVLGPGGKVELAPDAAGPDISAAFGILHRAGQRPLTDDELDGAIADAVSEKHAPFAER